ncbi:FAD-binding oxidoreductase [Amycolatopsis pithecellobii]|uniref:FAD-binding protein n=1 Tax=Amycolatopsis pithecellobii TaxID=664692 RepID=A0A6N7YR10_9PSEU|nr:FAD-binding oxidoreductase [Amycolatopsis pithecellobii]MTD55457.1 FAD-binding protein [Amycolatopsis pithecellobii]
MQALEGKRRNCRFMRWSQIVNRRAISRLERLRGEVQGGVYMVSDKGYDQARTGWNLSTEQRPALVVMAERAADIVSAVGFARDEDLTVGVMATGHGITAPVDEGSVLVNTSRMRDVHVMPETRTARVSAGAKWADLIPKAAAHGLAGLWGSTSDVGIVGYTLGGGFGWLGRKYGLACDSVKSAEVVTSAGELVTASAEQNADLFWGLKGGDGNFGVVTSLEFSLYPVSQVYGGNLFYPIARATEVLDLYSCWSTSVPDDVSSTFAFTNLPPLPEVPASIRGKSWAVLRFCYSGDDLEQRGEDNLRPWREELEKPAVDTIGVMPYGSTDTLSMDPVDPVATYDHTEMLTDLSPAACRTLIELCGETSGSPLIELQIRHLGGAASRPSESLNPMGHNDARFLLYGLGGNFTSEMGEAVGKYLARVAADVDPHTGGTQCINFLALDGATPERVRAAYTERDWERLVATKDRWDPANRFRFNHNIPPTGFERLPR